MTMPTPPADGQSEKAVAGNATVSVVIPAFNRPDSLRKAVASAAAQLGAMDEIIVVDDGSSPPVSLDGLGELPCAFRLVVKAENGGPASARNRGIREAAGDLIAFLDSDDIWLAGKLPAQKAMLDAHAGELVAVACGWRETVDGAILRERLPVPSASRSDFFAGCWFCPGSTLLLARSAFDRIGPFREDVRRLEDMEWFLRFAREGGRLLVSDVIGASIARGGNARPDLVEHAAATIERELDGIAQPSARARGDLAAYFDLERAGAFRNIGDRGRAAFYLARSLARRPRLQAALRRWWR